MAQPYPIPEVLLAPAMAYEVLKGILELELGQLSKNYQTRSWKYKIYPPEKII